MHGTFTADCIRRQIKARHGPIAEGGGGQLMSGGDFWVYLRALGKEGSNDLGLMRIELPAEIGRRHLGGHSNHLPVTKHERRQRPIVGRDIR